MASSHPNTNNSPLTKTTSNRLPAPSLFVGPPSRNASNTSLLPTTTNTTTPRIPLIRQRSLLDPKRPTPTSNPHDPTASSANHAQAAAAEAQSAERTDAIWAEMQNTLEEVELSAEGPHGADGGVFGVRHERALAGLREAQIALAEAWGRSEGEVEVEGESTKEEDGRQAGEEQVLADVKGRMAPAERVGESGKSALEEETMRDVEASRRRREANERYFRRVNAGVLEVVEKLEVVARMMKGVELESKEIWRDTESVETGSTVS
ncbi:uncharacterized protein BDZ99DRAFT_532271 [Mytilinidion resinicola]|uniref:Uncharacterized protein n=1 Tax=Mytilinidion resinicola TaxID=574789 RepID=A0A6A6YPA6_9PEZI|nr:uncharacterized protein BDZ99DRAFT_532271 [Mytilinidion resinicola]KAF2809697.1 hypothetical protein BDZ99DRAFT_532271 [Mytilinidion resinicola]